MIQLFNYFRSSASFRVRIALNLKGLDYKDIPINLLNGEQHHPDYQLINPQGLVPAIQIDDKILSQSLAIIEYLDEVYKEPPLLPVDPYQKAEVRAFALAIAAEIHPLNNVGVLQFLTNEFNISEEQKNNWYQHWITKGLSALETKLQKMNHQSDFCFGDSPTIADLCLVPQLFNARRFHCDVSSYKKLVKIDVHCQTHPAFIKAWPNNEINNKEKIQ